MSTIAIIGPGWVGAPLARSLSQSGHKVIVSRRSADSLALPELSAISGFVCDLANSNCTNTLTDSFRHHGVECAVGAFPPGFRQGLGDEYIGYWTKLAQAAQQAGVKKLVMLSSTTVYPVRAGLVCEEDASLDQALKSNEFSDKARAMLRAEQVVIDSGLDYVIIRFSGLYGPERHPARFVRMLKQVSNQAPANMLHREDAVGVTRFACEVLSNTIVNATSPKTVDKAAFYQRAVECYHEPLQLPPVVELADKRISADKLCRLGYQFTYNSTLDGLEHCN
jgi:nucleoside-diphosphate-sugar epimerase